VRKVAFKAKCECKALNWCQENGLEFLQEKKWIRGFHVTSTYTKGPFGAQDKET